MDMGSARCAGRRASRWHSPVFRADDPPESGDALAPGYRFDPKVRDHDSREIDDEPLVTALARS